MSTGAVILEGHFTSSNSNVKFTVHQDRTDDTAVVFMIQGNPKDVAKTLDLPDNNVFIRFNVNKNEYDKFVKTVLNKNEDWAINFKDKVRVISGRWTSDAPLGSMSDPVLVLKGFFFTTNKVIIPFEVYKDGEMKFVFYVNGNSNELSDSVGFTYNGAFVKFDVNADQFDAFKNDVLGKNVAVWRIDEARTVLGKWTTDDDPLGASALGGKRNKKKRSHKKRHSHAKRRSHKKKTHRRRHH
jgi:mRNA-degrading endonuclease HigB of HigAB toxin-antitoxin module